MRMTREQATVKLDIDAEDAFLSIRELTRRLRRAGYRPIAIGNGYSPSGKGQHVVIHVSTRPTSPFEVVALQLLLGGDREREAMQLFRARSFLKAPRWMRDYWNVLYLPHPLRQRHLQLRANNGM